MCIFFQNKCRGFTKSPELLLEYQFKFALLERLNYQCFAKIIISNWHTIKSRNILEISCLMQHACNLPHPFYYKANQQLSKTYFKASSIDFMSLFVLAIIYYPVVSDTALLLTLFYAQYLNRYQSMCFLMRFDNCIWIRSFW